MAYSIFLIMPFFPHRSVAGVVLGADDCTARTFVESLGRDDRCNRLDNISIHDIPLPLPDITGGRIPKVPGGYLPRESMQPISW